MGQTMTFKYYLANDNLDEAKGQKTTHIKFIEHILKFENKSVFSQLQLQTTKIS